jgi:hypothetical protein
MRYRPFGPFPMHEALCRPSGTTLDTCMPRDRPPMTQRTSGLDHLCGSAECDGSGVAQRLSAPRRQQKLRHTLGSKASGESLAAIALLMSLPACYRPIDTLTAKDEELQRTKRVETPDDGWISGRVHLSMPGAAPIKTPHCGIGSHAEIPPHPVPCEYPKEWFGADRTSTPERSSDLLAEISPDPINYHNHNLAQSHNCCRSTSIRLKL